MCRSFVPQMKGRGYGRVINISSIMAHISLPQRTAYSASKAGLLGFTARAGAGAGARQDHRSRDQPRSVPDRDDRAACSRSRPHNAQFSSRVPLGRWGQPEEIGKLALYLSSDEASFITGTDILVDGGWCAQ